MKYLIIESHPYGGSFNAALTDAIAQKLSGRGEDVQRLNLVNDRFDPVMRTEDLMAWKSGSSADPKVKEYQNRIEWADALVFVFPTWWAGMPAVLKGFIDKVIHREWAYHYDENGSAVGHLAPRKAYVVATMQTPLPIFEQVFRNPIKGSLIDDVLSPTGLDVRFVQLDEVSTGGREKMARSIQDVLKLFD